MGDFGHMLNETEILKKKVAWFEKRYGPYIEKRGLGNWKNLFRMPTLQEWTILFMIMMALFISWAYTSDTQACRDTLENLEGICIDYCESEFMITRAKENQNPTYPKINIGDFIYDNG